MREIRRDHPMTVIIATHDPQIAARCDRMIRLKDGAVIDDIQLSDGDPADEAIRRPACSAEPARRSRRASRSPTSPGLRVTAC